MEEVRLKVIVENNTNPNGVRRTHYRALVMGGDKNGDVGFGQKIRKTENIGVITATGIAISAIRERFHIARDSWHLQNVDVVLVSIIRLKASFQVHLKSAPEKSDAHGSRNRMSCPPLQTASIKDCRLRVEVNPKLHLNLIDTLFHALSKLNANPFAAMGFQMNFQT